MRFLLVHRYHALQIDGVLLQVGFPEDVDVWSVNDGLVTLVKLPPLCRIVGTGRSGPQSNGPHEQGDYWYPDVHAPSPLQGQAKCSCSLYVRGMQCGVPIKAHDETAVSGAHVETESMRINKLTFL